MIGTGDDDLVTWTKESRPVIELPPQNEGLVGFRDPYIIQRGVDGNSWKLLLGSGVKGKGGTLLLYESENLLSGKPFIACCHCISALGMSSRGILFVCSDKDDRSILLVLYEFCHVRIQCKCSVL